MRGRVPGFRVVRVQGVRRVSGSGYLRKSPLAVFALNLFLGRPIGFWVLECLMRGARSLKPFHLCGNPEPRPF